MCKSLKALSTQKYIAFKGKQGKQMAHHITTATKTKTNTTPTQTALYLHTSYFSGKIDRII